MKKITEIQKSTVMYWFEYFEMRGYYPTIREARDYFGTVSTNAIYDRLRLCSKKGLMLTRARDGRWMLTDAGRELCRKNELAREI